MEAAQGQRVADVVAMLEGHDRLWQQQQRLPPQKQRQPQQDGAGRPGLLGHAALLAARCLADPRHGGSARHAQAFVELLVERRALAPRQARSAVHAVLQAFDRDGDLAQVRGRTRRSAGGGWPFGGQKGCCVAGRAAVFSKKSVCVHAGAQMQTAPRSPLPPAVRLSRPRRFHRPARPFQTLAAAARVYDTGDASSTCLMPGERPPPSTLALLLAACGRAGRGDLLMGVWRHLGPQRRQGADGAADAADGQGGPGSSAAAGRPPSRRAAHALVEAAVLCDLRAAGLWGAASGSAGDSGSTGSGQRALQVPGTGAVSPARRWRHAGELGMALFGDSCLADALSELHDWLPDARQHQQPGAGGVEGRAAAGAAPGAPAPAPALLQPPLLPPDAALAVLRGCGSVDDVDALLLSQLLHPSNGLSLREMRRMLRARAAEHGPGARPGRGGGRAGEEAAAAAAAAVYDRHPMSGLLARAMQARAGSQLQQHRGRGAPRPGAAQQAAGASAPLPPPLGPALFPPVLPPPLAAAAVAAYMRHGAVSRAAAVARAAGSSGLQDQQALQRLAADCARAGLLLPALNAAEALRSEFWRAPAPYAAAELMRCAARAAGPPLGAGCTPGALASLWRRHGVAHPVAWGALLRGLWETGDTGQSLRPALLAAMAEPLPLTGLDAGGQAGAGARAADAARSQIVGELVRAMLERDPGDRRPRAAAGVAPAPGGRRARFGEGAAAAEAGLERGGGGSVDAWLESAAPGLELWLPLPYQEQPALAARVEAVLQMLAWLRARGVSVRDDALLAAALQALRACRHGGDAHASGEWSPGRWLS